MKSRLRCRRGCAVLLSCVLLAPAAFPAAADESADVIIVNARAFVPGSPARFPESIAIRGNRIIAVGSETEQPFHASPNQNILEVWAVNLGPERASRAWSWKSIHDAGGRLAFGTDWPVVELDLRPGLHTALTRQTPAGQPPGGFVPSQRLPLATVLEAYTSGAAYAAFDEGCVGTLAPGQLADIVIWSDTPLFSCSGLEQDSVYTWVSFECKSTPV
ncbi:MAG: amidohydrolase family protein [Gammaproteobacteria bacterium]|nr:amidohydrolase family protein [Gammaproteobacteria bacterium]